LQRPLQTNSTRLDVNAIQTSLLQTGIRTAPHQISKNSTMV